MDQVFFDSSGRRCKVWRRLLLIVIPAAALLLIAFRLRLPGKFELPRLLLSTQPRAGHPLIGPYALAEVPKEAAQRLSVLTSQPAAPKPKRGLRAAFYVTWDATSYLSLRESLQQIDLLFPEWLSVLTDDGQVRAISSAGEDEDDEVPDHSGLKVEDRVTPLLAQTHAKIKVYPEVNNYDNVHKKWVGEVARFFPNAGARAGFRRQVIGFLASGHYDGLMIDFENIPTGALAGYRALIAEVAQDLHARGLKLYVAAPADDSDYPYESVAERSDGVIAMNYDQHFPETSPGPLAAQDWFTRNLQAIIRRVPHEKLICGIANYGYDWSFQQQRSADGQMQWKRTGVETISAQQAWEAARHAQAAVEFDRGTLNPHSAFDEDPDEQHYIWFTDAATALNQMRAAQRLGVQNFALWRLGSEDRALWQVWEHPEEVEAPNKLRSIPPGHDIDYEDAGEMISITGKPAYGERTLRFDRATGLIEGEEFQHLPRAYEATQYGAVDDTVAITFDDGPDTRWTPKMLDVLKAEHVPATFFVIGSQAVRHPSLLNRIYREGHEIGNHTWSHPDISKLTFEQLQKELNMTEWLLASQLGVKPLLFRPPYSIDVEPETDEEVRPIELAQAMGYLTVGSRIDPRDWFLEPKPSAGQIVDKILDKLDQDKGNIILLHDGGGNREQTVRALPLLIHQLRAEGYNIVPLSQLLGKSRREVMPPVSLVERWPTGLDHLGFEFYAILYATIMLIFFGGNGLMTGRLLMLACLAACNRFRHPPNRPALVSKPAVAVLVPAYNEEKVIVRTVRAALNSDYPKLRVIVIDDGSTDQTLLEVRKAFSQEPRVRILTKPQAGKAMALNYGLEFVTEEIFVGIDADTYVDPQAISLLVPHFADPEIAGIAGNTRVGNQVNLWTRWQALEYLTSQNFERRGLDVFGVVTVVPGAIGAWRTAAVRQAGGYPPNTVAEDADLTLTLLERGYRVHYEDRALAYTEAPHSARGLMRQRSRWSFGILQAMWKHRGAFKHKGVLGWMAMPNIVIFHYLLPLLAPLLDVVFLLGVADYFLTRQAQMEGYSNSLIKLLGPFFVFFFVDFLASAFAMALERPGADRWKNLRLLGHVWLQRFVYRQLFSLVMLLTVKRVIEGYEFHWGKLERTAALQCHLEQEVAPSPIMDEDPASAA